VRLEAGQSNTFEMGMTI